MDARGPMNPYHAPIGLDPQRAILWCVTRTVRDIRLSIDIGRGITLPNALRLFERRVSRLMLPPVPNGVNLDLFKEQGLYRIRSMYSDH